MNAKSTSSRQKLMAMAIVAMFAMCAFSVCLTADSDAGSYGEVTTDAGSTPTAQKYSIDVSVNQQFTYSNIDTNLDTADGTVTITGSGTSPNGATVTGFGNPTGDKDSKWSVQGTFTHAGTYVYTMTAKWSYTAPDASTPTTLTQTATQQITFNILDDIDIKKTDVFGYAIKGEGAKELSLEYSGPTTFAPTLTGTGSEKFTAAFNASGNAILITPNNTVDDSVSTYDLVVKVQNTKSGDSDSANITYQVFDKISVTSEKIYTYEGQTSVNGEKTMVVSWDAADASHGRITSKTFEFNVTSDVLKESTTTGEGKLSVDVTSATPGSITGDATKKEFVATLTVNGTLDAGEGSTETQTTSTGTYTLVVYKGLAFMSKPQIEGNATVVLGSSANNILLNSYITGARSVTINWGDGTANSELDSSDKEASYYNAYHAYGKGGLYTITITATNDMGTTTSQVLYNAGEGDMEIPTDPENTSDDSEEKSFFDVHGYQFLIFLILTVLLLVAFFFFGIQNPVVIIIAIVTAALTVLCFVYNDIGGVIDAVKGLFDKA